RAARRSWTGAPRRSPRSTTWTAPWSAASCTTRTAPAMTDPAAPLLRTEGLTKHFRIGSAFTRHPAYLHAVDDVSLSVGERQIVALAGESGSGKSTVARLLAKLYRPPAARIS